MVLHSSPINRRKVRHDPTVSASERDRIKADAIRKIRMRQEEATKRRVA